MEQQIIPKEKRETIRQELNIEKWPLFATSTYRKKSREITREVTLENGDKATRKVTIGKINEDEVGILRIADYKILCALVKLWEEAGRPANAGVNFALHEISHSLRINWGGKTYKEIRRALTRLKAIPITWEDSFYQKDTKTTEKMIDYFNILEDLKIFERKRDKADQPYFAFSIFKLNYRIVNNLLNNYSKPLYLDVILKFKKEISVLLYGHIDLIMADKNLYERKTQQLFGDLELSEYNYPSQRKRLLEPVLEELEGIELTTGVLSQARLEKTMDGKDWKVVFKKSKKRPGIEHKKEQGETNKNTELVIELFNKRFPHKRGTLIEDTVEKLIREYSFDKVMLHISRISNDGTVNNPAGLLRISLEKDWDLPPTKEEAREQERKDRDEIEKEKREQEQKKREKYLKEKDEEERLNKIFLSLSSEEQESLKEEARQKIVVEHMEDSQEKTSKFFLMDIMVMIKVREIIREQESKNEPKY
ncbi:MAG: replication initiator protein A [Candidatus Omnitrophota bacterium]